MRHCLLMTVYKDVEQINHLISKVPVDWGIYVHIDLKSKINTSEIEARATTFKKYRIYWGSLEHVKAFLYLMEVATSNKYDYYHLITGQDYFASNPNDFDKILGNDLNSYLDLFRIPRKDWRGGEYSVALIKSLSSYGDIRYGILHKVNSFLTLIQKSFIDTHKQPKDWNLYGGSVYCSLHYGFVSWILQSSKTQKLLKFLKNTTCGEEVFFQTLIMESPYKDKVCNTHLRYIDWSSWCPPKILKQEDYNAIISNKCLFCRKLDYQYSSELVELLDKALNL